MPLDLNQTEAYIIDDARWYTEDAWKPPHRVCWAVAGERVFPTLSDAEKCLAELEGTILAPTERCTSVPAAIFQVRLPHAWLYDTKPLSEGHYALRFGGLKLYSVQSEQERLGS